MIAGDLIAEVLTGALCICLGAAMLHQLKRETIHPLFKTWWSQFFEDPDTIDFAMCCIVGAGFLLVGSVALIAGIYSMFW